MMKTITHVLLILSFPVALLGQTGVWQTEVVADNIDLRQTITVTLDSLVAEIPSDGRVFVKFDGNCTSSPGDRIILAASAYNDWDTNDGCTSCTASDPAHLTSCFNHSRVYDVTAGSRTFYAVGQNYVDLQGTGIASINGHLTVIFVANDDPQSALAGTGIVLGPISWDNPSHVFGSVSITAPVSGQILVNFDGFIDLGHDNEALYTTNLSSDWPDHPEITSITTGTDYNKSRLLHRKSYHVEPGTYEVYALGQKVMGELNSTTDYLYATLSALFIPDNSSTTSLESALVNNTSIDQGPSQYIGHLEFEAPMDGKALIQFTGRANSAYDDLVNLTLTPTGMPGTVLGTIGVQPVLANDAQTTFSASGITDVSAGTMAFDVIADFDPSSSGSGIADLSGLFTVQYVANAVTSATHDAGPDPDIVLYPNPTPGDLNLRYAANAFSPFRLTIYSSTGQVLRQHTYTAPVESVGDLRGVPDGSYLIGIQRDGDEAVYRIVKSAAR